MRNSSIHAKKIGLLQITSLVTGNLVGSGAFLLPAALAAFGSISLLGWVVTATGALFLSLMFGYLGGKYPKTGGPHVYVDVAFGKTASFFTAWGYWCLTWISNTTLAVGAVSYLAILFGGIPKYIALAIELGIVICLTLINLWGIRTTGKIEILITMTKLVPLLLVPLLVMPFINFDHYQAFNISGKHSLLALNSAAFITVWAFAGLESGTVPSGEVFNPKKTIPLATILGVIIATAIYILGTFALMGVMPLSALAASQAPYAEAVAKTLGGNWQIFIVCAAILCCLGTLHGWTLVVGRIALGAAQDNLFPRFFRTTSAYGAPFTGVIISAILSCIILIFSVQENMIKQFNFLIDAAVTMFLIIYIASALAYLRILLRINRSDLTRSRIFIGICALAFSIWALCASSLVSLQISLLILVGGLPMYWVMRKRW